MSVHFDAARQRFVVRWKDSGKRRCRRFRSEAEAVAFDARVNLASLTALDAPAGEPVTAKGQDGIYPYATRTGVRWRIVFRQSDGTLSSRRGFTSPSAAAAGRRQILESIRRGEIKVARDTSRHPASASANTDSVWRSICAGRGMTRGFP